VISLSSQQPGHQKDLRSSDEVLSDFAKAVLELAETLERDVAFDPIDQVVIENLMHVAQGSYSNWKRRNGVSPHDRLSERPAARTV
jgi:hypothetical protein